MTRKMLAFVLAAVMLLSAVPVHGAQPVPTCTEQGDISPCGSGCVTRKTDPQGHEGILVGAAEPSCHSEGYTGDEQCVHCGILLAQGAVIPKTEHIWGEWELKRSPDEYADGERIRLCTQCPQSQTELVENNPFTDVPSNRFEQPILWAYYHGITMGTTDTTFSPEDPCTRAQIVMFLWRSAGSPEPESMENPFEDVGSNSRFLKPILWAYCEGITLGTTDTTFSPNDPCTRKQIVTFLWRSVGSPEPDSMKNPFEDVPANRFQKAILWAYCEEITTGTDTTHFSPEDPCTRQQIVTFLYRAQPDYRIQIFGDSQSDNDWGDRFTWVDLLDRDFAVVESARGGASLTYVEGKGNCVVSDVTDGTTLDADCDVIVIFAGSNDWAGEIKRIGYLLDGDPSTVYGALEIIIRYIRAHSEAKILVITPLQRNNAHDQSLKEFDSQGNPLNKRGYSLEQFSNAMEEVCAHFGVECLDLYHDSGVTRENILDYTDDGLHANETGEAFLVSLIQEKLLEMLA